MEFYIVSFLALVIGGAIGIVLGKGIASLIRSVIRATDKCRLQTAMLREKYLNDLYEECIYEKQDRLARKAAKEMSQYDNDYY
ncbi:hypothetical protein IKD67_02015 [Candidatus Saccharibacteria bacterium]|nr:hypothetical protein [Candidatus Saccharibacteria bacterium]